MGRKRKEITDKDLVQIGVMAGLGLTEDKIAAALDMSPATFRKRKNGEKGYRASERIASAISSGRANAELKVSRTLYARATAGDMTALKWYEQTRCNRSEKHQIEVSEVPSIEWTVIEPE